VGEKIERLKNYAYLTPNGIDILGTLKEYAVNNDFPGVIDFKMVNAPEERRLTRAGRSQDNYYFALLDVHTHAS
jgi:hypothetical protein